MGLSDAIMSMAADSKSRTLALATGSGLVFFVAPKDEGEWQPVNDMSRTLAAKDTIALTVDVLTRHSNLFVVGYASGIVRLFQCENGALLCEIAAHSR
jgi:hypothetical protein